MIAGGARGRRERAAREGGERLLARRRPQGAGVGRIPGRLGAVLVGAVTGAWGSACAARTGRGAAAAASAPAPARAPSGESAARGTQRLRRRNRAVLAERRAARERAAREGGASGRREGRARVDGASGRRERATREGGASRRRERAAREGGASGRRGSGVGALSAEQGLLHTLGLNRGNAVPGHPATRPAPEMPRETPDAGVHASLFPRACLR